MNKSDPQLQTTQNAHTILEVFENLRTGKITIEEADKQLIANKQRQSFITAVTKALLG